MKETIKYSSDKVVCCTASSQHSKLADKEACMEEVCQCLLNKQ